MNNVQVCDIGIMAYNEGKNIGRLLSALNIQKLEKVIAENLKRKFLKNVWKPTNIMLLQESIMFL